MENSIQKIIQGYNTFRKKYATGENSIMHHLAYHGQKPEIMVISCCDSRVDPALILQCDPGDLFIVRNLANIVPPYKVDESHHGTSAAIEFGICHLNVKHLIILGHSQCGAINVLINNEGLKQNDFISHWVSLIEINNLPHKDATELSKQTLNHSYRNCLTFPWIKKRMAQRKLAIHLWFFEIQRGEILSYCFEKKCYQKLTQMQ